MVTEHDASTQQANKPMIKTSQTCVLPCVVWVKRRDSVCHSTRRQPLLQDQGRGSRPGTGSCLESMTHDGQCDE